MKILHTVESYDPASHGMQQVVKQLSERLVKEGHEVIVATRYDSRRKHLTIKGVKIEQFKISGKAVTGIVAETAEVQRYKEFLISSEFDIITNFAAQQWATDIALPLLKQIKAVKVFVPTGFSEINNPKYSYYFDQMKTWMGDYDVNVFLSDDYQDINFAKNNNINKTELIPNGAAEEEFIKNPSIDIRKELDIPSNHFLILHVGSHTGLKGHKEAIKIFKKSQTCNSTLLIVGNENHSGPLITLLVKFSIKSIANLLSTFTGRTFFPSCSFTCKLTSRIFKLSLSNKLRNKNLLVKNLSREQTISAYMEADLFLFPSNIECSPLVLFESMASETPFLTTDVGNAKEIISWSQSGLLIPTRFENGYSIADIDGSAKVLDELLNDYQLRQTMKSNGRKAFVEQFSWKKIAKKYEIIYDSLLENRKRQINNATNN